MLKDKSGGVIAQLKRLISFGPEIVIITNGNKRLYAINQNQIFDLSLEDSDI